MPLTMSSPTPTERGSNQEMLEPKKSGREKGGKKPRKALEPKREETERESRPAEYVAAWQPGCQALCYEQL